MNEYVKGVKEKLKNQIKEMTKNLRLFVKNPEKDFSRERKLPFGKMMELLISMGGKSIYKGKNMGKANRYYTEDFKRQIVELEASGKKISEIEREYKVTKTTIREWIRSYVNRGKFGA